MPAARRKYEEFSAKYLHIASIDDMPQKARELYLAFGFVQPKVSDVEFKRLIALVKALAAPLYFPFYPKMVRSIIKDYELILTFDINQLYRFSLTCDLKLLRLFYQGLELSLPNALVEQFASSSANPLEGQFKYFRAAGCFVEHRGGVPTMLSLKVEQTETYKNRVLDCGYFIEFCLFQYQLTTGIRLTKQCGDKARQFKRSPAFTNWMNRFLNGLNGVAMLDKFAFLFGQSCTGFGGVEDRGFSAKCKDLLECFFHPQYPEPRFDEVALRRQTLAHPLLWNMSDVNKRSYAALSHVTGNRLSLDEKLHLPLRSNVMLPHEFAVAIDYFKSLSIYGVRLFLMFLTAKPIGYLSELVVSTVALKLDMGDYIDISRGVWVRRPVHTPKAFEPTSQQQEFLYAHRGFIELPLPKLLVTLLQKQIKKSKLVVAKLAELIPNFNVAQSLNVDNRQRTITEAAMRSGLFTYLAKQTDANYAALVLANSEYVQFTHLYYLSRSHNDVISTYANALVSIGFDVTEQQPNECYTGSKMAVKVERLAEGIRALGASVKALMAKTESSNVEALINAHNAFALYTVFMLACATTHRPRKEFNFSGFTCDDSLCLLADKVNFDDSKIRINPLPTMVTKQVEAYRNHCRLIAKQLPDGMTDIKAVLFAVSRDHACGVAEFGVINSKHKWQGIGKAQLDEFVEPFVPLPLNVFRHHLASMLRNNELRNNELRENKLRDHKLHGSNNGIFAQQLLGHISNGEHPLAMFSPCKMVDVLSVAKVIDGILVDAGFELIECKKPRGVIPKLALSYMPYIGNLEVPTREKYQWLMQWAANFVQTHYIKPKASERPAKQAVIEQAVAKFESKQERQKVAKFVSRFIHRYQSRKTNATWNDIKFSELELGVNTIHLQKQADKIRLLAHCEIKSEIKSEVKSEIKSEIKNKCDLPFKLVLSLIVNGGFNGNITDEMLIAIKKPPIKHGNLYWCSWVEKEGEQQQTKRQFYDSVSLCLRLQNGATDGLTLYYLQKHFTLFRHKLARIEGIDKAIVERLIDLNALASFLAIAFDKDIPATLRYYRANMIETTNLTDRSLARFISGERFFQARKIKDEQSDLVVAHFKYQPSDIDAKKSLVLIRKIARTLSDANKNGNVKSKREFVIGTITCEWQAAIGSNSNKLHELIRHSTSIAPTTVGVLTLLLDVASKPGRGREHKAIGTITTYLSNIAKPLLYQDNESAFFEMDDEELEDLYLRVLESRNIDNRGERAALLRRFHRYMMEVFYVPEVDWYEIEPTIDAKDHKVSANIISLHDYEKALNILKKDKHSIEAQRNLNMVCLILCYRLGLRSGEVRGLQRCDINTKEWIIHVRSNRNSRKKSLRSNRRIPARILLSETEKQIIRTHFKRLNSIHYVSARARSAIKLSLYSSDMNHKKLINFYEVVSRVIEALRLATADETLRLHHARHSCATHLKLILEHDGQGGILANQLKCWARADDLAAFANNLRAQLTGFEHITHRCLPALATLVGHRNTQMTARHYIHCYDIQLLDFNEYKLQQHYTTKFIASMMQTDDAYARQVINRSKLASGKFNYLITKVINNKSYRLQTLRQDLEQATINELSEKPLKNELYEKLNQIHAVLQFYYLYEDEERIYKDFNIHTKFSKKVLTAAAKLTLKTRYTGYPIPAGYDQRYKYHVANPNAKPLTTRNYFADRSFKLFVLKVFKLIETDYNYDFDSILQIWLRHYHLKYELITGDMNITLQKFIKNLGLTYSEEKIEGNHLALRFVDRRTKKIKLRLNKNDRYSFNAKFNYLMYLLGICAVIDVDGKKAKREEEAKRWFRI